jgi:hypothetical protein
VNLCLLACLLRLTDTLCSSSDNASEMSEKEQSVSQTERARKNWDE